VTPTEKSEEWAATEDTAYGQLTALFGELAELDPGSPRWAELRDRLVTAHLPLAHRVARRFSHRGEPQDDLEQNKVVNDKIVVYHYDTRNSFKQKLKKNK